MKQVGEMEDLTKSALKLKAKEEIVDALQKLVDSKSEYASVTGVPFTQEEEYKEVLRQQAERVSAFLGI